MNKKGEDEYKEGYNTISAADLHNEMGDDVKIILGIKKTNILDRDLYFLVGCFLGIGTIENKSENYLNFRENGRRFLQLNAE